MTDILFKGQKAKHALQLMKKLTDAGFEVYIVGGIVRDFMLFKTGRLLKFEGKDYDLTTNATPEQIMGIMEGEKIINNNGLKHGTVTINRKEGRFTENYEITTYRIDGDYSDGRHPDSVLFTNDLTKDLSRRDLTINAMAISPEGKFIDPFKGIEDIIAGRIRAVGDPEERFREDALRIIRAVRFASRYNFEIEDETKKAIIKTRHLLDQESLSPERKADEIKKISKMNPEDALFLMRDLGIIDSVFLYPFSTMDGYDQQHPVHVYDLLEHSIIAVGNEPTDIIGLLIRLFHDVGKPDTQDKHKERDHMVYYNHWHVSAKKFRAVASQLKLSNNERFHISNIIRYHMIRGDLLTEPSTKKIRRWLRKMLTPYRYDSKENKHPLTDRFIDDLMDMWMGDMRGKTPDTPEGIAIMEEEFKMVNDLRKLAKDELQAMIRHKQMLTGKDAIALLEKGGFDYHPKLIGMLVSELNFAFPEQSVSIIPSAKESALKLMYESEIDDIDMTELEVLYGEDAQEIFERRVCLIARDPFYFNKKIQI